MGEENVDIIPKTVLHKKKIEESSALGVRLSVCEICYLNCVQRIMNEYLAKIHTVFKAQSKFKLWKDVPLKKTPKLKTANKRLAKFKYMFFIKRCLSHLRGTLENLRAHLPPNFRPHLETFMQLLQDHTKKSGTTPLTLPYTKLQKWIIMELVPQEKAILKQKRAKQLSIEDVVLGVCGANCDPDLINQLIYLTRNSNADTNRVLNTVPLHFRKMLTYGTVDALPVEDEEEQRKLPLGDLIMYDLVDEAFCRQLMDAKSLTEYDVVHKKQYLKDFVPEEYQDLAADEFDRVVAQIYMERRDTVMKAITDTFEEEPQDDDAIKTNTNSLTDSANNVTSSTLSSSPAKKKKKKKKFDEKNGKKMLENAPEDYEKARKGMDEEEFMKAASKSEHYKSAEQGILALSVTRNLELNLGTRLSSTKRRIDKLAKLKKKVDASLEKEYYVYL